MTETNKVQDQVAMLRDALRQLAGTLERTRAGVEEIVSQVARVQGGVDALGGLLQRETTAVAIDMLGDAATAFRAAFRELASGLLDAQGDIDALEAALADDADGQEV